MSKAIKVTEGSDNIFADLGLANPEGELLKAKLIRELCAIIKRRRLNPIKAAERLGLKQSEVFALTARRGVRLSIDQLVRCLDRLNYRVDLVIKQKPARRAVARAAA